jgi:DNA-binding response OmpR family regulator/anti-sigma regulatory factor (Ser/Thr protein kinase)
MKSDCIVIVDDEEVILDVMRSILHEAGYAVVGFNRGGAAVEYARENPFEVLLVDYKLPDLDGIETFQTIKSLRPDVLGVLITAFGTREMAIQALNNGIAGFVEKPVSRADLLQTMTHVLERQRLNRENVRLTACNLLYQALHTLFCLEREEEAWQYVVEVAAQETGAATAAVLLLDDARKTLNGVAAQGLSQAEAAAWRVPVGTGLVGAVAASGQPLLVLDEDSLTPVTPEGPDVAGRALGVPLRDNDQTSGVLYLRATEEVGSLAGGLVGSSGVGSLAGGLVGSFPSSKPANLQTCKPPPAHQSPSMGKGLKIGGFRRSDLEWMLLLATQTAQTIQRLRQREECLRKEKLAAVGKITNTIVHDLRNPLSTIRMAAEMVEQMVPESRRYAQIIMSEADRLTEMCEEVLAYTRGDQNLKVAPVDVATFLEGVAEALAALRNGRQVVIETVTEGVGQARWDEKKMRRAVYNLGVNACEAMPGGGTLTLAARAEEDLIQVQVADTGCGMPPEVATRVFEPFFTQGKPQGTGLGGAIVKSIVEAHGGTVDVTSEVGQGTTFRLCLPREAE